MPTREEEVSIHAEGRYIAGTLVSPSTLIPGVLFVHGWGGSPEKFLSSASRLNTQVADASATRSIAGVLADTSGAVTDQFNTAS